LKLINIFVFVVLGCIFLGACKRVKSDNYQLRSLYKWNAPIENGVLEKIMIPFFSNITEMSLYNKSLLFQQEKLDTSFVIWDIMAFPEKIIKFGQVGSGPSDVLNTSLLLHEPDADIVRVLDG
jgi:hypothetical protein